MKLFLLVAGKAVLPSADELEGNASKLYKIRILSCIPVNCCIKELYVNVFPAIFALLWYNKSRWYQWKVDKSKYVNLKHNIFESKNIVCIQGELK